MLRRLCHSSCPPPHDVPGLNKKRTNWRLGIFPDIGEIIPILESTGIWHQHGKRCTISVAL